MKIIHSLIDSSKAYDKYFGSTIDFTESSMDNDGQESLW